MNKITLILVVCTFAAISQSATAWVGNPTPRLHVDGRYLKDSHGNTVNLHGVAMTPSPWFNGCGVGQCRWNDWNVANCLAYNDSVMDVLTDTTRGWYLNYIRLHIDPYWTNTHYASTTGESDISKFNENNFKIAIKNVIIPLINHAKSRGMYVILRPPGVCPDTIGIGGPYQKYLLKVWGYLSQYADLKNADNVMFELANEPISIRLPNGSYGNNTQAHFDQMKQYFQAIVDTIRANGAQNILWIPGTAWQSQYKGYAVNPIDGTNIGYSAHIYPGFMNGGPDYNAFAAGWNENLKPVADFAPVAITEIDWSPKVGVNDKGESYNMGTWGTGTTGDSINPGFGYNFKRLVDKSGNVSWNLLCPEDLIDKGSPKAGLAFGGIDDACAKPCKQWFQNYSKANFPRPDFNLKNCSDNGNGTYTNPVVFADFPDPDVIRVGDVYYMLTTTMAYFPGATILKSYDLVNWSYCSNPLEKIEPTDCYNLDGCNAYARGQWASTLGYKNGKFYLIFNTLTEGSYLMTATSADGVWTKRKLNDSFYDPGLLFDDNGKTYIVYGIDELHIAELDSNFVKVPGTDKVVFTYTYRKGLEGSHLYKINGNYYIYSTYGGWPAFQVALRSADIYGTYEEKVVINDENIHQGALIKTQTGEWWTMMFYDKGAYGRLPNLQPISWVNGWPVAGVNGKGVTTYAKPNVGKSYLSQDLPTNDNFRNYQLAPQWQWNHNPDNSKWSLVQRPGFLRMYSASVVDSLPVAKNMLTQRILGYRGVQNQSFGTIKLHVAHLQEGDVAGLAVFQNPYAYIGVKMQNGAKSIVMNLNGSEQAAVGISDTVVYLRAQTNYQTSKADFYYSFDNISYSKLGSTLDMKYDMSIFTGNRYGIFNFSTKALGGFVDVDWFTTEPSFSENKFFDSSFKGYSQAALTLKEIAVEKTKMSVLPGSSKSLSVKAIYNDGRVEDATFSATYESSNPEIIGVRNGVLIAKQSGEASISIACQDVLGGKKSLIVNVTCSYFPLSADVFNPSIYASGTYNEATHTLVTGQYGFGGWNYTNGINLSGFKYLVVKLRKTNSCGAVFKLYDQSSYWSAPYEVSFGSNTRVVLSLSDLTRTGTTTKLDPTHIYYAGIWSYGGCAIEIDDIYLTNNADYSKPTDIDAVSPEVGDGLVNVYSLRGFVMKKKVPERSATSGLASGLYIVGKKKVLVNKR